MEKEKLPACCTPKNKSGLTGLIYGIIPHAGCIAFLIGSILGVTVLTQIFKPLLMNRNFFYYLIILSLAFATLSAFFYLKNNKSLSREGLKKNKKYLFIMYSATIGINIIFFFIIFPYLANINNGVSAEEITYSSSLKIAVDIPCPGHAPLISNELKTISGVKGSEYTFPNKFVVYYDETKTNTKEILSLDVFKEYPAKTLDEPIIKKEEIINTIQKSIIKDNVQIINMNVDAYGYSPNSFILKKGIPVKWIIDVKQLNGCNQQILLEKYNIKKNLNQGENIIEFTPIKEEQLTFTCGMKMIKGTFLITNSGSASDSEQKYLQTIAQKSEGGCGCNH